MEPVRLKIKAEGDNCQAAHTINNNYSVSFTHIKKLCDWVMIGSGVILIFSIICLSMVMHDYWATMLCFIIFGFGFVLFFAAFFPFLYLEYGIKKSD